MKKIIGLLLISLAVFFNIDGVEAEVDWGTYSGACKLNDSQINENLCSYNCNVTSNVNHSGDKQGDYYINFNYYIKYNIENNTEPEHSIEVINTDGSNEVFGDSSQSSLLFKIFSPTNLIEKPIKKYIIKNDKLNCRSVVPSVHVRMSPADLAMWIYNDIYIEVDMNAYDEELDKTPIENSICGMLGGETSDTTKLIKKIYRYIKIIIPILVVALSMVDFIKVVTTGKDDDMKKAINKFIKRIIVAIIFVLVPLIVQMLINISGLSSQYESLGEGVKTLFCILG